MIKMNVGNNIKQMRLQFGMTQAELAKVLGVSRPTISSWEVDRTEPSDEDIQTMALFFGCSVNKLVGKKYTDEDAIRDHNISRAMHIFEKLPREQQEQAIQYLEYIRWTLEEEKKNGKI